jgi:serine/threonine protein kinase
LQALHYLHSHGVLHRDLKGSNVLVGRDGSIKLADFGLAKCMYHPDLRSTRMLTNRVVTLWYRPPEVLLGATSYGPSVDMWGVGCILLELIAGRAVFTGQDELTQLRAICERCGPVVGGWPWLRLMGEMPSPGISLESEFGAKLGEIGMNLVHGLLAMDPEQRIDTEMALRHPWFQEEPLPCHSTELISPTIEGDWHEFEFKQRKRNVK